MKVAITNHLTGRDRILEGSAEDIERDLLDLFPWARSPNEEDRGDIEGLVELIDSSQMYTAEILEGGSLKKAEPEEERNLALDKGLDPDHPVVRAMLGHVPDHTDAFEAAAFLAGHPGTPFERMRRALWDEDGDHFAAALRVHALEPNETNLRALRSVIGMNRKDRPMSKAEQEMAVADVKAGVPEGEETAQELTRAFRDHYVFPIKLAGKHSAGSMLAKDEDTGKTWLLKPGAGGESPVKGENEQPATQSEREAAFWHIADKVGLGEWYPKTDLVLINGKQFAAIRLIPWSFKTLDARRKEDGGLPQRLFFPFLNEGLVHMWAALDFVAGNADRHANNVMVGEDREVQLIDHGSSLAGRDFDPGHDQNAFVPYYLRAWSPSNKFQSLPPEEKLEQLPRVSEKVAKELSDWLSRISANDIETILLKYGADPTAILARLAKLKHSAIPFPCDEAINMAWAGVG